MITLGVMVQVCPIGIRVLESQTKLSRDRAHLLGAPAPTGAGDRRGPAHRSGPGPSEPSVR